MPVEAGAGSSSCVIMTSSTQPIGKGEAIELKIEEITLEGGLAFITEKQVEPLLRNLKSGGRVFEKKTNVTFIKAYSVVQKFGAQRNDAVMLYSYYKKVLAYFCGEALQEINQHCAGEE